MVRFGRRLSGPPRPHKQLGVRIQESRIYRALQNTVTDREINEFQKRVSFRAEWSERSERNAVEESHKQSQAWDSLRDSSTPLRPALCGKVLGFAPLGMTYAFLKLIRRRPLGSRFKPTARALAAPASGFG